ncbi:hypothetical protein PIROE2DRAFT_4745 [Piromyces sp. E2]|nr:hypothetical protein PIROE2DRAFT_4745 [Piromyces sp. E2]|eukprot:OUM67691.1 hypothetical protein PIROE2DRAFT_4745 [Piromyces sp. E2]
MKYFILLFTLVNGIVGENVNRNKYGNCEVWNSFIKTTGFDIGGKDCCNTKGFKCQDSKVTSM